MIRSALLIFMLALSTKLPAMQKLPEYYRVVFGEEDAEIKVTEYFSFACPHCIALFKEEFSEIEQQLINAKSVQFEFHPIPVDMNTVQAMVCLEKLDDFEKRIFLSVLLGTAEVHDDELNTKLMIKAMEMLKKPLPELADKEFLMGTDAFYSAFNFLKQDDHVESIPSVSVDGVFYAEEVPTFEYLSKLLLNKKAANE